MIQKMVYANMKSNMDEAQKLIDTVGLKPNRQGFYSTGYGRKSLEGLKTTINDIMGTKEHNGWSNYKTWIVNLWLTNDEETYNELKEIIKSKEDITQESNPYFQKAEFIKDIVWDILGEDEGLKADLIGSALEDVDWLEIIENHLED